MLKIDRKLYIEKELFSLGSVSVNTLASSLNCSGETIRRDLKELEESGLKIKLAYGGAYLIDHEDVGVSVAIRKTLLKKEKHLLADFVCNNLIEKNDIIMLDSSTTCVTIAQTILSKNLPVTIITNSLLTFKVYTEYGNTLTKLIGIGGIFRDKSCSFVGLRSLKNINSYLADKCFISCPALDLNYGLLDTSSDEAGVRLAFIQQSKQHILVADHTKFTDTAEHIITNLNALNIVVTDKTLTNEWENKLNENSIICYYANNI